MYSRENPSRNNSRRGTSAETRGRRTPKQKKQRGRRVPQQKRRDRPKKGDLSVPAARVMKNILPLIVLLMAANGVPSSSQNQKLHLSKGGQAKNNQWSGKAVQTEEEACPPCELLFRQLESTEKNGKLTQDVRVQGRGEPKGGKGKVFDWGTGALMHMCDYLQDVFGEEADLYAWGDWCTLLGILRGHLMECPMVSPWDVGTYVHVLQKEYKIHRCSEYTRYSEYTRSIEYFLYSE